MSEVKNIKIVTVGSTSSREKTKLLICYAKNTYPEDYIPTVYDNFQTTALYDNKAYNMGLWDTAGQEDYDRLRPMSYPDTNVVLMVFSIVERESFDIIEIKWIPEVNQYLVLFPYTFVKENTVPVVLVGVNMELRDDEEFMREHQESGKLDVVTKEEGLKMASRIGATYRECNCSKNSADGLKEVFAECVRVVLEPPPPRPMGKRDKTKKKEKCCIQ